MSKFLPNLLLQFFKSLLNSKIQFKFRNPFIFFPCFRPSRPASPHPALACRPAQAAWPTVPHPSPQAGPSLSACASLAYFVKYVFFCESRLPSAVPSLSPLADMWTPHVSFFFPTAPAEPVGNSSRRRPPSPRAARSAPRIPLKHYRSPHHFPPLIPL
jgi:hypothetical protein